MIPMIPWGKIPIPRLLVLLLLLFFFFEFFGVLDPLTIILEHPCYMNVCISYGIDDWNFKSNWTADYFDIRCKNIYIYIHIRL